MKITGYLVFSERKLEKVTHKMPAIRQSERAIKISLTVPPELFARKVPECEIVVNMAQVQMPPPAQVEIESSTPVIEDDEVAS